MKKIVKKIPEQNVISFDCLPKNPIVGFKIPDNHNVKGWLQPNGYESKKYYAFSVENGVKNGNGWSANGETKSLNEWLDWSRQGVKVDLFLFENEKELFAWLAK